MTATLEPAARHSTQPTPYVAERRGRAMGSSVHLVATGDEPRAAAALDWAMRRIDELEQRWSRFLPTSEISQLNASAGTPVTVSDDTLLLVQRALEARTMSNGRFDPTLLQAMHANGYDRTFMSIKMPAFLPQLDLRQLGFGDVTVDAAAKTVALGATTGFDPGGIGKGLAADLVAEGMVARGAAGALVNLGGDIRCLGDGPAGGGWVIAVGDDHAEVSNQIIEIAEGGVASSTRSRRRWKQRTDSGTVDAHHLLDPATGRPAPDAALLVTVIAAQCSDAEWLATSIAADGQLPDDRSVLGDSCVLLTDHTGTAITAGAPERFLR